MSVRKIPSGKWLCECYPYGASGKRIRKQFATKSEALSYERRLMNSRVGDEFQDGSGPRLSELVARWFEMYGKTLSSGAERKVKLESICSRLGDPFASQFDKNMFATYRKGGYQENGIPRGRKNLVKQPLIASSHIYMLFLPN
ncbi:integrase [Escherichia phage 520873]|uniref:integrase n=1 Tax=Escherichia phage 520873 TaxID=2716354 RepID=UPI0018AD4C65|nr:integrase [Escherichia phage 520873]